MQSDEEQIRQLTASWLSATRRSDIGTVLDLMTDDAVFLMPGHGPMTKKDFAEVAKKQSNATSPRIDGTSEIQEIKIIGDWAFMWTKLSIVTTPIDDAPSTERYGHTLTILKKEKGKWLLARDANMLSPVRNTS